MKPEVIVCTCGSDCPGFKDRNLVELLTRIRTELPVEYAVAHPFLCDEDGERFLVKLLKDDGKYIVAACDPKKQLKLLKDGFEKAGVGMEGHLISVGTSKMTTEEAFEAVKKAIGGQGD